MFVLAHTGPCRAPEVVSTIGIASAIGIALFRPWRRKSVRDRVIGLTVPVALAAIVTGGACAPKSGTSPTRPSTPARLAIESPAPNEVTGPNLTVRIQLVGGQVVQRTSGKLSTTEGHIHVSLDGTVVLMAYTTSQDLHDLKPGSHSVRAEFVAIDHAPFKNRPAAVVLFTVRAP